MLNGFFGNTGGGVEACVDLFGCVDLGPFLFSLYLLGGREVRYVDIDQYVPHDSSKCVGGVSKFLLAAAYKVAEFVFGYAEDFVPVFVVVEKAQSVLGAGRGAFDELDRLGDRSGAAGSMAAV